MKQRDDQVARAVRNLSPVRHDDIELGPEAPEAQDLLAFVLAQPAPGMARPRPRITPHRGRRPLVVLATSAVAVLVLAIVIASSIDTISPQVASAGFSFRTRADRWVEVRVLDPSVGAEQMNAELAAQGFRVTVRLQPVSPSLVGHVTQQGYDAASQAARAPDFKPLYEGSCYTMGGGWGPCTVGVLIPKGYPYRATIVIGRQAAPGEPYNGGSNSGFAPGEALHCKGIVNTSVEEALPILADAGFTTLDWRWAGGSAKVLDIHNVPDAVVTDVSPFSSDEAAVYLSKTPSDPDAYPDLDRGCPDGTGYAKP